jgi:hypothetical protein
MIRILDGLPDGVIGFEASGKLTTEDFTQVLAPAVEGAARSGKIRILLDFGGDFDALEAGALWQDLKMGVRDWNAWERIALVTDHAWMRDGLNLFSWAVPGEAKAFPAAEREEAIRWLTGGVANKRAHRQVPQA